MRITELLLNAAVVACVGLASIIGGFWADRLLGVAAQLPVQLPVALVCGVAGIVAWLKWSPRARRLSPARDYVPVFLLVFPVGALLVVVGHYLATGYLTGFGNIAGAWIVLFAEVLVALPIASALGGGRRSSSCSSARLPPDRRCEAAGLRPDVSPERSE